MRRFFFAVLIACLWSGPAALAEDKADTIRIGYFPNITHAQAVLGIARGDFARHLYPVRIETKVFNAGPSVIEALFAGELDLAYVGPNPAINGYLKSGGEALRIVAGAASGGAALVVRRDLRIDSPADFHSKRIATPQLGNTQDVALRAYLKSHGLVLREKGGDVQVLPVANPEQLTLFAKKEIDAAWTIEPWVSRLVYEGGGRIFLDEASLWAGGEYVTAVVIVRKGFLEKKQDLVRKWLETHVELTLWIQEHAQEARGLLNGEIKKLTGKSLPEEVLRDAFSRIKITYDPLERTLDACARGAFEQGFLGREEPNLVGICDLALLKEVLGHAPSQN